jgi:hypothetical protein
MYSPLSVSAPNAAYQPRLRRRLHALFGDSHWLPGARLNTSRLSQAAYEQAPRTVMITINQRPSRFR